MFTLHTVRMDSYLPDWLTNIQQAGLQTAGIIISPNLSLAYHLKPFNLVQANTSDPLHAHFIDSDYPGLIKLNLRHADGFLILAESHTQSPNYTYNVPNAFKLVGEKMNKPTLVSDNTLEILAFLHNHAIGELYIRPMYQNHSIIGNIRRHDYLFNVFDNVLNAIKISRDD